MAIVDVLNVYALLSGIMSISLFVFTMFFEKDKKKSRILFIWSVLFLASSFGVSEYALWTEGYNLFEMIFKFNFPLIAYFCIWFAFLIWLFESRGERKVWVALLVILLVVIVIAMNCMNCIRF